MRRLLPCSLAIGMLFSGPFPADGEGRAHVTPPADARDIGAEKVWLMLSDDAHGRAVLEVTFGGPEDVIHYHDVQVKAFDSDDQELAPEARDIHDNDTFSNLGFSKYRGDASMGFYKFDTKEENILAVTVAWRGEKIVFAPPKRSKRMNLQPIHGGKAGVTVANWTSGEAMIDVFLKGMTVPVIAYQDVKVTVFDAAGVATRAFPLDPQKPNFVLASREHGVFTGLYRTRQDWKTIRMVILEWGEEKIELTDVVLDQ